MNICRSLISRLVVGLVVGSAVGACEEDTGTGLVTYCANEADTVANCDGISNDCFEPPCHDDCVALGQGAADFSEACGKLWIGVYECIADMSCEGLATWRQALEADTVDYPCGKLESEFRQTCPNVPLFGPNS